MSNKMSEKMPNIMPNKIPEKIPEKMPNIMPNKMSNKIPEKIPNKMSFKSDKYGNISGYVKKEHHDKVNNNLNKRIESLTIELEKINESYINLENNHNIFLKEYKKKCEEYNKVLLKLEKRRVKKELLDELEDYKNKVKLYSDKYGNIE